jgi:hypothetical protein
MSGRRGRYGTSTAYARFRPATPVLSPLERFYGPVPSEPVEVPACPACGGRPCPGCGATALDLFGGEVTTSHCADERVPDLCLFGTVENGGSDYREM